MGKVSEAAKTSSLPQLKPANCGGADLVVATIATVEFKKSAFKDVVQPVLTFKEDAFAEFEWRAGKRSVSILCEKFGDETDEWIGQKIPLIKRFEEMAKQGKGDGYVYQVPPVTEWAALFKRAKR